MYGAQQEGEKVSNYIYIVSSYTPTLTAVLELSDPVVGEGFHALMVAQASPPGASPIPKTEDEVQIIHGLSNGSRRLTGENATVQRVQEGMMESDWIHLAWHGQQNPADLMESGFLLHDRILELLEIVRMSLPKADFAFPLRLPDGNGRREIAE